MRRNGREEKLLYTENGPTAQVTLSCGLQRATYTRYCFYCAAMDIDIDRADLEEKCKSIIETNDLEYVALVPSATLLL